MQFNPNALLGTILDDKYKILSIVGSGGMGTVFKAEQIGLERVLALKILHEGISDEESRARFEREALALSRISHRNVAIFYGYGVSEQNIPYIAMELVAGENLHALILAKRLDWRRSINIVRQACEAMEFCHSAGIVHRDLKPDNIILTDTENDSIKIVDFGLSKLDSSNVQKLTQTGALLGSLPYMAPELCAGLAADPRSDIYSLGCILYEALTSQTPHQCDNPIGLLHKHRTESVVLPSLKVKQLPDGIDEVVLKALAKDPEHRYQRMTDFEKDLSLVSSGNAAEILASPIEPGADKKSKSNRPLYVCSIALVAMLAGGYMIQSQKRDNAAKISVKSNFHTIAFSQLTAKIKKAMELGKAHKETEERKVLDSIISSIDPKSDPLSYMRISTEFYNLELNAKNYEKAAYYAKQNYEIGKSRSARAKSGTFREYFEEMGFAALFHQARAAVNLKDFNLVMRCLEEADSQLVEQIKHQDFAFLNSLFERLAEIRADNKRIGGPAKINAICVKQMAIINDCIPQKHLEFFNYCLDDAIAAGKIADTAKIKSEYLKQLSSIQNVNAISFCAISTSIANALLLFPIQKAREGIEWIESTRDYLNSKQALSSKYAFAMIEARASLWNSFGGSSTADARGLLEEYLALLTKADRESQIEMTSASRFITELLLRHNEPDDAEKMIVRTEKVLAAQKDPDPELLLAVLDEHVTVWIETKKYPGLERIEECNNSFLAQMKRLKERKIQQKTTGDHFVFMPEKIRTVMLWHHDDAAFAKFHAAANEILKDSPEQWTPDREFSREGRL